MTIKGKINYYFKNIIQNRFYITELLNLFRYAPDTLRIAER